MKKFATRICGMILVTMMLITSIFAGTVQTFAASKKPEHAEMIRLSMVTPTQISLVFSEGYIEYGGFWRLPGVSDKVYRAELNEEESSKAANYTISSTDDANYATAVNPKSVNRKSKLDGVADVQEAKDGVIKHQSVQKHTIYLNLDKPLVEGKKYAVTVANDKLNCDKKVYEFVMNSKTMESNTIHTSTVGYLPESNAKYAYISEWTGDGAAADLSSLNGVDFHLMKKETGEVVYSGKVAFRAAKDNRDGSVINAMPSFSQSDVYECNFSDFKTESGDTEFVISVAGVGISPAFKITAKAFDDAFYVVTRGIYHQRNGIALDREYTEYARARNYHPDDGFLLTYGRDTRDFLDGIWGWYSDAGDNDGYSSHLIVPKYLLLTYEMKPEAFKDGDLNIPESGNGIPDLVDEGGWLVNFGKRVRAKTPTGGTTVRITSPGDGAPNCGSGSYTNKSVSWEDQSIWWIEPENASDTYEYAGLAAQYAYCLDLATGSKHAESDGWIKEAKEAYDWAEKATGGNPGSEDRMRKYTAAAWIYKYTGEQKYLDAVDKLFSSQYGRDTANTTPMLSQWGTWALATSDKYKEANPTNYQKAIDTVIKWGDAQHRIAFGDASTKGGAFRYTIPQYMPQCIGNGTTPFVAQSIVAHKVTNDSKYLDVIESTANYTLGGNPLNLTWLSGLNEYSTKAVFKIDWFSGKFYNGKGYEDGWPGIIPYGINAVDGGGLGMGSNSMYNSEYAYYHDIYPAAKEWPAHEGNFNNKYAIMTGEFTIHQNQAPAAAAYGYLSSVNKTIPEKPGNVNKNLVTPYFIGSYGATRSKITSRYYVNGAKITLYNGKKAIGSAIVKDNKYSIKNIKPQPAGSKITLKASKATWKTSPENVLTKKLGMKTPKFSKVTKKSKTLSGTGSPLSKIVVKLGKKTVASGKIKANGTFKIKVKGSLKKGAKLTATVSYKSAKKTAKIKVK